VTPLHLAFLIVVSSPVSSIASATGVAACDLAEQRSALFRRATITPSSGIITVALPALFAPRGFLLAPGPIAARGPASVTRILERDSLNATSRLRAATIGGGVSMDGTDGFTYGYFDTFRANGDSVLGSYHAYWRREVGGDWKILALVRRRRPPGAMTPAQPPVVMKETGCIEPSARADTVAPLKEIMATDLAFSDSAAKSVGAAFGTFAADDAAKSGKESAYVYGKAAIAPLFDPPPATGLKWAPEIGTVARSGDFGFTVGSAGPRIVDPNAAPPDPATAGHYFTIWRRDASGRWRYIID
jgi:ketosteroid isomerase-like protein